MALSASHRVHVWCLGQGVLNSCFPDTGREESLSDLIFIYYDFCGKQDTGLTGSFVMASVSSFAVKDITVVEFVLFIRNRFILQ